MRKIEQNMVAAIRAGRNFSGSNTLVRQHGEGHSAIYLHGHLIAEIGHPERGTRWTLAGWNTPTTRSRINALARAFNWRSVCTRRGEPHVSEARTDPEYTGVWRPIGANDWVNALA